MAGQLSRCGACTPRRPVRDKLLDWGCPGGRDSISKTLLAVHYLWGHLVTVCVARGSFLRLASQVGVGAIVQVAGLCARRVVGQGALQIGGCVCLVCLQACARCCVPGLRRAVRGGFLGLIPSYPEIATPLFEYF